MNQAQPLAEPASVSSYANLWPKISIITPSYNQAYFLETCITSVLGQGYPDLEYIIIDGGSTDGSVEIIKKYEDQITFWVSEPDEGQSDAINKGFQMATGAIVAWLNSDDFYLPGALTAVAEAHRSSPHASFYFGDGWRVDEAGQPTSGYYPDDPVFFNREALIFGVNYILQPATFINRACLVKVNYLDPNLYYGMDTDLWIRLSQLAPPLRVPAWLAAIREYGTTKTSTGSFRRVEELRRIAETYSGLPITPGIICYFLDTLYQFVRERSDIFPKSYQTQIEVFWAATAQLMAQYGARPDGGFPIHPAALFSQISDLSERLRKSETDRAARRDVIERLKAQLDDSEADRAARLAVINKLSAQLAESEADRAAQLAMIDQLNSAQLAMIDQLNTQRVKARIGRATRRALTLLQNTMNNRISAKVRRTGANFLGYIIRKFQRD